LVDCRLGRKHVKEKPSLCLIFAWLPGFGLLSTLVFCQESGKPVEFFGSPQILCGERFAKRS